MEITDSMLDAFYHDPQDMMMKPVCECDECRKKIYPGDTMFHIRDEYFCEECIERSEMEAESDYDYC